MREVERSVSRGKRCNDGELRPLSGLMFCADCGHKMKSAGSSRRKKNGEMVRYRFFNCLDYTLFANRCFSHYISEKDIHAVMGDCNLDGTVSVADAVMLQKWLLRESDTLTCWRHADLCKDQVINVFDLALLKKMLSGE